MSYSPLDYPRTQTADAEREAEYAAIYACHAFECGDPEDVSPCDDCRAYFCLDHLTEGLCTPCQRKAEADGLIEQTTGMSVEGIAEPLADAIRGFLRGYDAITSRGKGRKAA